MEADSGYVTEIHELVRERYAGIVKKGGGCCAPGSCGEAKDSESLKLGYTREEAEAVPEGADLGLGVEVNRFQIPGEVFSKERHRLSPDLAADWERIDRIVGAGASSGSDPASPFGNGDFMTFGEPSFSSSPQEAPSSESALSALSDARYMVGLAKEVCRHLHGIKGTAP